VRDTKSDSKGGNGTSYRRVKPPVFGGQFAVSMARAAGRSSGDLNDSFLEGDWYRAQERVLAQR
jgi:hypothetical protein